MNIHLLLPDMDAKTAALGAVPESERWDLVSGSAGQKVPTTPSADEDDEGLSDQERLVEKGIANAERDQMIKAGKYSAV